MQSQRGQNRRSRTSRIKPVLAALAIVVCLPLPANAIILDKAIIDSVATQETPPEVLAAIPPARPGEMRIASASGLSQSQLIALGRFLFEKQTFQGNGRTCATCHPATNNFTLDPEFISRLPATNPLFVAETNPALKDLENPQLTRSLALICENVDGFDKPCVFRGVPHTLALRVTTTPPLQNPPAPGNILVPGTNPPVALANSTGWSGDGAPIGNGANGELRLFALGAVVQHFTKTMNRVPGVDFRVPSNLELDARLQFQLSLGRQLDFDLASLTFRSPVAEHGKQVFQDQDPTTGARCSLCHNNAGSNRPPNNANAGRNTLANTRVELIDRGTTNDTSAINSDMAGGSDYISIGLANTQDAIKVLKDGVYLLYPDPQNVLSCTRPSSNKRSTLASRPSGTHCSPRQMRS